MMALSLLAEPQASGQVETIARTFGVDWPHLIAQTISFSIVCALLYWLAYRPVLTMLAARREQIAGGLANAEKIKAELARIESQRQEVLAQARVEAAKLIENAHAAAARVEAQETQKAHRRRRSRSSPRRTRRPPRIAPACSPSSSARSGGW